MAKSKQYKNVYTILEKVKKGEIDSYYTDRDGLFGKVNFYKKPELVKPYLHYFDAQRVHNIVNEHVCPKEITKFYSALVHYSKFRSLDPTKKPDLQTFTKKVLDNYNNNFPKSMENDIFNMYYHRIEKLEFEERTAKNNGRFKFLERANNPIGKIMTESSSLKSAIFTRNTVLYYLMQMTAMDYIDPDTSKKVKNNINGTGNDKSNDGQGNNGSGDAEDAIDKMFDNNFSKTQFENALKDAQDLCNNIDKTMSDDIQEKLFDNANNSKGGNEAGKISPDYIRKIAERLATVNFSMNSLKEKIKNIMDKSMTYFSAREIVIYEDLFNSENLAALDEYIMLHPKLRKVMAEDIQIKDIKKIGKIDVYIDISGSMSSSSGAKDIKGNSISKIDFSKSFVAKLKEMDMLNDVYLFDNRVKKCGNDLVSIAMIDAGGGTTINNAVNQIERIGNNAIVITDAEDHCNLYSNKAFFIGVQGANFHYFESEAMKKYSNHAQVIEFTGTKIYQINENGKRI